MRWLDSITDSIDTNFSKLQEIVEDRGAWSAIVHGVTKSWTLTAFKNTHSKLNFFNIFIQKYLLRPQQCWVELKNLVIQDSARKAKSLPSSNVFFKEQMKNQYIN